MMPSEIGPLFLTFCGLLPDNCSPEEVLTLCRNLTRLHVYDMKTAIGELENAHRQLESNVNSIAKLAETFAFSSGRCAAIRQIGEVVNLSFANVERRTKFWTDVLTAQAART